MGLWILSLLGALCAELGSANHGHDGTVPPLLGRFWRAEVNRGAKIRMRLHACERLGMQYRRPDAPTGCTRQGGLPDDWGSIRRHRSQRAVVQRGSSGIGDRLV